MQLDHIDRSPYREILKIKIMKAFHKTKYLQNNALILLDVGRDMILLDSS